MPYQDEEGRDYSYAPDSPEQIGQETLEFAESVMEIQQSIQRMGVNVDIGNMPVFKIIETLIEMLFAPDGPLPDRQGEFFWLSNRKQLEVAREAYARAMEAKLTIPKAQGFPFP